MRLLPQDTTMNLTRQNVPLSNTVYASGGISGDSTRVFISTHGLYIIDVWYLVQQHDLSESSAQYAAEIRVNGANVLTAVTGVTSSNVAYPGNGSILYELSPGDNVSVAIYPTSSSFPYANFTLLSSLSDPAFGTVNGTTGISVTFHSLIL